MGEAGFWSIALYDNGRKEKVPHTYDKTLVLSIAPFRYKNPRGSSLLSEVGLCLHIICTHPTIYFKIISRLFKIFDTI